MSYHLKPIEKGVLGEFSKIREEFLEAEDGIEQRSPLLVLNELADLIGAIEAYANNYHCSLDDLIKMKDATKRAFQSGRRGSEAHFTLDQKPCCELMLPGEEVFDPSKSITMVSPESWGAVVAKDTKDARELFPESRKDGPTKDIWESGWLANPDT